MTSEVFGLGIIVPFELFKALPSGKIGDVRGDVPFEDSRDLNLSEMQ